MIKRTCGIYKITDLTKNRIYIGSSNFIEKRWIRHKLDLKYNKHSAHYMQRVYNKRGLENFKFEIIEICEESNLLIREQYYIDSLIPEFNSFHVAARTVSTEEMRKKISMRMSGENNYFYGKKRPEHSKLMKENPPFKDYHHTIENRIDSSLRQSKLNKDIANQIEDCINKGYGTSEIFKLSKCSHKTFYSFINNKILAFKFNDKLKNKLKENNKIIYNKNRKINNETILEIKQLRNIEKKSLYELADYFKLGVSTISAIANNKYCRSI